MIYWGLRYFSLFTILLVNLQIQSQNTHTKWQSEPDIANITLIVEKLLSSAKDDYYIKEHQKEAGQLYADLERAMIYEQNFKKASENFIKAKEYLLFELSNKFNLITPIEKLKRDYTGSLDWLSGLWSKAHGAVQQSFESVVKSAQAGQKWALDNIAYVANNMAQTFNPQEIGRLLENYLGANTAKDLIKKIAIMRDGLTEASENIRAIADYAIKHSDLDPSKIIVLENPDQNWIWGGEATSYGPFALMILKSLADQQSVTIKSKIFTAFHEAGHIYYQHSKIPLIVLASGGVIAILATTLSLPLIAKVLVPLIVLPAFKNSPYSRSKEKEADLFACDKLSKINRPDIILMRLGSGESNEHFEKNVISNLLSREIHPSVPENKKYLIECMDQHGYHVDNNGIPQGNYKEHCLDTGVVGGSQLYCVSKYTAHGSSLDLSNWRGENIAFCDDKLKFGAC